MAQSNLWIDISHIISWQGNLTGIERVEYHLIKYYYNNTDCGFTYWDPAKSVFVVATRVFVKKNIIDRASETEHRAQNQTSLITRIRTKIVNFKTKPVELRSKSATFVILAGLWDKPGYIAALKKLAKRNRLVHVVHDMIPLVHPEYMVDYLPKVFGDYMYQILPACSQVMAISKNTATDIAKVLKSQKLKVPKITIFREGDNTSRAQASTKPEGVKGDFILAVSTIEARKNHQLLLDARRWLFKHNQPCPQIIVVGKRGWLSEDFQKAVDAADQNKITILDKITDSELTWLYQNCLFTAFPSFYEGWGLPVTESLRYGKVTLSSNTSSMPEAGGKFADYFSPTSAQELAKLIIKYLDSKTRAAREKYIKASYKPLSWDESARQFAATIDSNFSTETAK